jgi:altronate hydrolase
MAGNVILVSNRDNVAMAIVDIKAGEAIVGLDQKTLEARADIPRNHKVAIMEIPEGSPVVKYGEPIGAAAEKIRPGDWVHTHNLKSEGE